MRIINNYLFGAVVSMTGLVLLVLIALGGFVEFLSQLEEIGTGDYDLITAIQYVLLKLPRLAFDLLPVSMLLGSLLGLGALASNSELIVLRAAGVSLWRMAASVALTGLAIAVIGGMIGELIAPKLDLYARQLRTEAKRSGQIDIAGARAWIRDGDTIFNVQPAIDGMDKGGVYSFEVNFPAEIISMGKADSIEADGDEWALLGLTETNFGANSVDLNQDPDPQRYSKLGDLLSISVVRESSMTAIELYRYVSYLSANGLAADKYEIAFWVRMAKIVGIAVMCVLALPFVFGNLRSSGAGSRMMIGTLIGLGYFLLNRTSVDSGAVFSLAPLVAAWAPTVLLAVITMLMLARVR
jgi:lipopolysaccharide export system permease protein